MYCSEKPSGMNNQQFFSKNRNVLKKKQAAAAANGSFKAPQHEGASTLLSKPSMDSGSKYSFTGHHVNSNALMQTLDSRMNNAQTRLKSYNKVTLMVVVLCFTNLICQLFTFVFIFESIFNEALMRKAKQDFMRRLGEYNAKYQLNSTASEADLYRQDGVAPAGGADYPIFEFVDVKMRFPKFLAYSLLLNNIFLCINHSCNIFIYTFTNPRFRRNLINLFKRNALSRFLGRCFSVQSVNLSARNSTKSHANQDTVIVAGARRPDVKQGSLMTGNLMLNGSDSALGGDQSALDKCLNCFRCLKSRFNAKSSTANMRSFDLSMQENTTAAERPSASTIQPPLSNSFHVATATGKKKKFKEPPLKPCRL